MKRIALLSAVLLPLAATGADHLNIEEGLPTQIEDAYPIAYRGREAQVGMRYDRADEHQDRFVIDPRVEFGFAPNWQGKISVPFYLGSADRTDSGNVGAEALYNFNTEGIWLPAFSVAGRADLPTGKDSAGIDTTLKAIVTRSITRTGLDRVHLNAAWRHNSGSNSDQRDDMYHFAVGYSRPVDADTVAIVDIIREQEVERRKEANIVEVGVRRQITPLTVISVGVGAGIGDESPTLRGMLGLQRSF